MYRFERHGKEAHEARYWNPQNANICIMASVTPNIDWAAYIGANPHAYREEEAMEWALDLGAKLSEEDARYFFPQFEGIKYRQ